MVSTSKSTNATVQQPSNPITNPIYRFLVLLLSGSLFGFALQRSRVHEYESVQSQMLFHHFLMLKMFLTGAATSTAVIGILSLILNQNRINKLYAGYTSEFDRGIPALLLGSILLGSGLAVCGSCPGTVFAQLGAGSYKAYYVLLGGILGAIVYSLIQNQIQSFIHYKQWSVGKSTLSQLLGISNITMVVIQSILLYSIVFIVEYLVPWQSDLISMFPGELKSINNNNYTVFSPIISGLIVGLVQLPLISLLNSQLGTSGSYGTICQLILPNSTQNKINYNPLLLVIGIILGSYSSSIQSNSIFHSDSVLSIQQAIIGGFLMVLGARITAGCTSGHGISGLGFLAPNSFITVAGMFGSGMLTAQLLYK